MIEMWQRRLSKVVVFAVIRVVVAYVVVSTELIWYIAYILKHRSQAICLCPALSCTICLSQQGNQLPGKLVMSVNAINQFTCPEMQ